MSVEVISVSFENDGAGKEKGNGEKKEDSFSKLHAKKEKILNQFIGARRLLMHIDLKLPSCGKWQVTRSNKQCQVFQHNLEKEFHVLAPKQPTYPNHAQATSQAADLFKQYFQGILVSTLVHTRTVRSFLSIPDEIEIAEAAKVLKEGPLKMKGKNDCWCTIKDRCLAVQDRKGAERYSLVVLLDGCVVERGKNAMLSEKQNPALMFKVSMRGANAKLTSHVFAAATEQERDSWVAAINASQKIYEDSKGKVSGSLRIMIVVEGRNLAAKDFSLLGGRSDPFVILRIENQQTHTPIVFKTLNPVWNSEFDFEISQNCGILYLLIYDHDVLKKADSMGQVILPLSSIVPHKEIDMWFPVYPKKKKEKVKGEIRLKISYEFTKEAECKTSVFGKGLEEIATRDDVCADGVPRFFENALNFVETFVIDEEGIFRISGAVDEVKRLKSLIDTGQEVDFNDYISEHDVVASLIKLYLRELPNPILTFEKYDAFVALMNSDAHSKISDIVNMLKTLPPPHKKLLARLLSFLNDVSSHSQQNMMSVSNLSIVFGPPLLRPKEETLETIYNTEVVNELVALLIGHSSEIITAIS